MGLVSAAALALLLDSVSSSASLPLVCMYLHVIVNSVQTVLLCRGPTTVCCRSDPPTSIPCCDQVCAIWCCTGIQNLLCGW